MRLMTLRNNKIALKDSFWDNLSLQTVVTYFEGARIDTKSLSLGGREWEWDGAGRNRQTCNVAKHNVRRKVQAGCL